VLTRVVTDYGQRPVRWLDATRKRYTKELSSEQKRRFAVRLGSRALVRHPNND
jgi:ABC-type sulfate/molybdate transport systems ATPase subunit